MSRHYRQRNRRFNRALEQAAQMPNHGIWVYKLEVDNCYNRQISYLERLATYRAFTRSIGHTVGVRKP